MKIRTTKLFVTIATLLFVFPGVAEALEIYFPDIWRNSMIHFRNDQFVAEIPGPPELVPNRLGNFRNMVLGPDGRFYISVIAEVADPDTGAAAALTGQIITFDPSTDTFDPDPFVTGITGPNPPALFAGPAALTFGGPNNDLYVAGGEAANSYVRRFDGTTGAEIGSPTEPLVAGGLGEPNGMAAHPDGFLLVGGAKGTIRSVDPVDGTVAVWGEIDEVTPGDGARTKQMTFSPDGSILYVGTDDPDPDSDAVVRFDAATGLRITDPPNPFVPSGQDGTNPMLPTSNIEGLAFSPDGSTLFVGNNGLSGGLPLGIPGSGAIYRVDPATGAFMDGTDQDGRFLPYIQNIGLTSSQGGPGTGDPSAPLSVIVLIPEPSSLVLTGLGVLALWRYGRRRGRRAC